MLKKNKSKNIWLEQGFKILESHGPGFLTIDNLVVQTDKTKGSFYYHFKSRNQYIKDLLQCYEAKTTIEILDAVNAETGEIARLKKLTELVFQISSRLELVIRAWALTEPIVEGFQERIDQKRLEHLKRLYISSGMNSTDAWAMALKNYAIYIGLQQLKQPHADKDFKRLLKQIFVS